MRLKLPAVGIHRDEPEGAELSELVRMRNKRPGIFRTEAEDIEEVAADAE